jgi:transposase-like protein
MHRLGGRWEECAVGDRTRNQRVVEGGETTLGELIHREVRRAIEQAVEEELEATLGGRYERIEAAQRAGYRNGSRTRTLTGATGPVELTLPRARLHGGDGGPREWRSALVPRYQRRLREVNEAIAAVYLSGGNTRRIRGALAPLLKGAPLSKSAVSRVVGTLKGEFEAWRRASLTELELAFLYLDAIVLKVRSGRQVTRLPVLVALGVLADGSKRLLALELCGRESGEAWRGVLEDLTTRGLARPKLCIVDGNPGLRGAIERLWPKALVQRCTVHKLRNLERKAPPHAFDEIKADYHRIVYAESLAEARKAQTSFVRKWRKSCPGVVASFEEGGEELLTFFAFPAEQWKCLRTTNAIERLNEEFRRRVKTQGSFPTEDAAVVLLYSLVASGQIKLRKIDGHELVRATMAKSLALAAAA